MFEIRLTGQQKDVLRRPAKFDSLDRTLLSADLGEPREALDNPSWTAGEGSYVAEARLSGASPMPCLLPCVVTSSSADVVVLRRVEAPMFK